MDPEERAENSVVAVPSPLRPVTATRRSVALGAEHAPDTDNFLASADQEYVCDDCAGRPGR